MHSNFLNKLLVFLITIFGYCINIEAQNLPLHFIKSRYDDKQFSSIEKMTEYKFKEIKILVNYQLDPKKENIVDFKRVEYWLDKYYPDKNSEGLLCIDLENHLYDYVKYSFTTRARFKVNDKDYNFAQEQFIKLAKFVKNKRPNIKIGYFGLPFEVYSKNEYKKGYKENLLPILKHVDVLFPSLYIPFPSEEKSLNYNKRFIKLNLETALIYSNKINKPIYPFIWYLYFSPSENAKYRNEMIAKNELFNYLKYIEDFNRKNNYKIQGIVWWDTPTSYKKQSIKTNYFTDEIDLDINKVLKYYFND